MKTVTDLAAALEAQRRLQKASYEALAKAAGITPLAARRALQAQTAPRVSTLMALADRLGLELVLVPKLVAHGLESSEPAAPDVRRPLTAVDKLAASLAPADEPPGAKP